LLVIKDCQWQLIWKEFFIMFGNPFIKYFLENMVFSFSNDTVSVKVDNKEKLDVQISLKNDNVYPILITDKSEIK
jgi:hypothetical protein